MAKHIDKPTVNALLRLRAPEFEPFLALLRSMRTEALESMAMAPEERNWRRSQGTAQTLKELLDLVDKSTDLAAKLNAPQ